MRTGEIDDEQFYESTLKAVDTHEDGYQVTGEDDWSFWLPLPAPVVPAVGDRLRLYGKGFGFTVRGAAVNGEVFFYRTKEEDEAKQEQWCAEEKAKKIAEYEANRDDYERRVAALPPSFQARFKRFSQAKADWWSEFGPYELFACEQAVVIANAFRDGGVEALRAWRKLGFDEQRKAVPGLSGEHSGNTFGIACRLAMWALTNDENVTKEHGALVPLVGCNKYGCRHD